MLASAWKSSTALPRRGNLGVEVVRRADLNPGIPRAGSYTLGRLRLAFWQ
jgi:hypothetical protein